MKTTSTTNEYTDEYIGVGGGHWFERTFICRIDENRLIWHIREMVEKYTKPSDKCVYVNIRNGDEVHFRACTPDEEAAELFKFTCMSKTVYKIAIDTYHELGKYAIWIRLADIPTDQPTNIGAELIEYISSLMA